MDWVSCTNTLSGRTLTGSDRGIERGLGGTLKSPSYVYLGRGRNREDGAALVEFAIVLPIFLMVILGLVTLGFAFEQKLGMTHSARETARYGATLPITNFSSAPSPVDAWLDEVAGRSVADAGGSLDPGTPGLSICVAFVHPDGTAANDVTRRRVETALGVVYADQDCFTDGRPSDERRVQVLLERDTEIAALVFTTTISLESEAVARYEASLLGS